MADESAITELEPETQWYGPERSHNVFGNMSVHREATVLYLLFALLPLIQWALTPGSNIPTWVKSPTGLVWGATTVLAYPIWLWLEIIFFEAWVRTKPEKDRVRERAYFKLMTDSAKNFWTAVLAIYTIAGIWSGLLR